MIEEMRNKFTQKTGISIRALASLALFCAGVWLVPSGIALHIASHQGETMWTHLFMVMHNTASLFFIIAAIVHIIINWKVLVHYVSARVEEYLHFKRELLIAVLSISGLYCLHCTMHSTTSKEIGKNINFSVLCHKK
jgi:hypothetical protein